MLSRLTRLFQADIHSILDKLEEPTALLKHSLREMQQQISDIEHQLNEVICRGKQLTLQISNCTQREMQIEPQLDLCFKSNNEILARDLVRQRLQWRKQIEDIRQKLNSNQEQQNALHQQLEAFQQQYEELQQKAEIFLCENIESNQSDSSSTFSHSDSGQVSNSELELAWLMELEIRDQSSNNGDKIKLEGVEK